MQIKIKVKPNSAEQEIKKINDENYEVKLKSSAKDNKANIELIKLLKKYFKSRIKIKSGLKSRNKIVEVQN